MEQISKRVLGRRCRSVGHRSGGRRRGPERQDDAEDIVGPDSVSQLLPGEKLRQADWIHVGGEVEALMRAISWGWRGWVHHPGGMHFGRDLGGYSVSFEVTAKEDERRVSGPMDWLESLDADFCFALQSLLVPPPGMGGDEWEIPVAQWLALDDVVRAAGWNPRGAEDWETARARAWDFIQLMNRVKVPGARVGEYRGPRRKLIDTSINASPWILMDCGPESLWGTEMVPERVLLTRNQTWSRLLGRPETAEWVPWGRSLRSIAGNQPTGAWARVMGLRLAGHFAERRNGVVTPELTRRELLLRYKPVVGSIVSAEQGTKLHPGRWVKYFQRALGVLASRGLITREIVEEMGWFREDKREGWVEEWLSYQVLGAGG